MLASLPPADRPEVPELLPWVETPWRAWHELNAERPHIATGTAMPLGAILIVPRPGPIPWTAMQAWCDRAGCDPDDRAEFVVPLIVAMDRAYLEHWQAQQNRPAQGASMEEKLARWDRDADGE